MGKAARLRAAISNLNRCFAILRRAGTEGHGRVGVLPGTQEQSAPSALLTYVRHTNSAASPGFAETLVAAVRPVQLSPALSPRQERDGGETTSVALCAED